MASSEVGTTLPLKSVETESEMADTFAENRTGACRKKSRNILMMQKQLQR